MSNGASAPFNGSYHGTLEVKQDSATITAEENFMINFSDRSDSTDISDSSDSSATPANHSSRRLGLRYQIDGAGANTFGQFTMTGAAVALAQRAGQFRVEM